MTLKQRINSTGAWVRKGFTNYKATVSKLKGLNMDDASFLLNAGIEPVYISRAPKESLHKITEESRKNGITPWWMTFPHSTKTRVDAYLADLVKLLDCDDKFKPEGIEIDAENKYDTIGWGPSGKHLAKHLMEGLYGLGVKKVYITCVIFRSGFRAQDMALLEAAQELDMWVGLAPQGYSKDDPKKTWDDGELFRPGVMQSFVMDWCEPLLKKGVIDELRMGGMVAFQNHPDPWPDDIEALRTAHDTAYSRGCRAWRYWALDQVGSKDGDEKFLREAPFRKSKTSAYKFPGKEPDKSKRTKIKELQTHLKQKGYNPGVVDGIMGPKTKAVLDAYKMALLYVPSSWADTDLDALIWELGL